jgi:GNAT superfamily N-acetyltransferase
MTSATSGGFWVRPPVGADHDAWAGLYASYAEFYEVEQTAAQRQVVWDWIMDPAHDVQALLLVDASGQPVGLAHFRPFARPLAASTGCFLDDLFVHPSSRGGGGAPVLLNELRRIARERGWSVVRWITADDNYRARAVYDRSATRTHWITYDMAPD